MPLAGINCAGKSTNSGCPQYCFVLDILDSEQCSAKAVKREVGDPKRVARGTFDPSAMTSSTRQSLIDTLQYPAERLGPRVQVLLGRAIDRIDFDLTNPRAN